MFNYYIITVYYLKLKKLITLECIIYIISPIKFLISDWLIDHFVSVTSLMPCWYKIYIINKTLNNS